ncbi:MAG TPA: hypothetical protein VFC44_09620 [Candidatus Saccharimonadales bacterium]|nr:hypothetical protein [Candidatus Saccharimonadales bacterium]
MNSTIAHLIPAVLLVLTCAANGANSFPPASELPLRPEPPDPLVMLDGHPVKTKKEWVKKRRPELKQLFQHYMYGWLPPAAKVSGEITYTDTNFFDGKATLQLVTIKLGPAAAPEVHLLMVMPNRRATPAPIFLGMNFSGNHTLLADPHIPLTASWMPNKLPNVVNNHDTEAGRGTETNVWCIDQIIDRGYAVATYFCGDVEPDNDAPQDGVRETIHPARASDDWGTIAAWAWGMERVMDYLVKDRNIDSKRIALVGHSRFGKATVVAGAFDDRVALVIPLQAGCGGTAPSRGKVGESVKQINDRFPQWFCGEFKQFNDRPQRLPFDQNCLIALCAPRPVLLGGATGDTWSNPAGAFEMLRGAGSVYRLLGVEGLAANTMPQTNKLIDSNLGFFMRPGKHSMSRLDWKYFLDFADKHLAR